MGGHAKDFSLLQAVYSGADAMGIGECQLAVPDSLQKVLGVTGLGVFVPSSPSGSLGRSAVGQILHTAMDYDAALLGVNLSNNSETAILVESLLGKLSGRLIVTGETLNAAAGVIKVLAERENTLYILTSLEAIKLSTLVGKRVSGSATEGVVGKVAIARGLAENIAGDVVMYGSEIIVCSQGKTTVTDMPIQTGTIPGLIFGVLGAFWTQQPHKTDEGLTTAAYVLQQGLAGTTSTSTNSLTAKLQSVINKY